MNVLVKFLPKLEVTLSLHNKPHNIDRSPFLLPLSFRHSMPTRSGQSEHLTSNSTNVRIQMRMEDFTIQISLSKSHYTNFTIQILRLPLLPLFHIPATACSMTYVIEHATACRMTSSDLRFRKNIISEMKKAPRRCSLWHLFRRRISYIVGTYISHLLSRGWIVSPFSSSNPTTIRRCLAAIGAWSSTEAFS